MRKVRPWKWMPFTNPARKDGLVLNHWRRVTEEGKDYPFARFNKICEVANYTEVEYNRYIIFTFYQNYTYFNSTLRKWMFLFISSYKNSNSKNLTFPIFRLVDFGNSFHDVN